jgi:hypothetical protein
VSTRNRDGNVYMSTVEVRSHQEDQNGGAESPSCSFKKNAPRFRGVLMRRRCDLCGTRIGLKCEGKDRVVLRCPECQREYIFFEHPE